MKYFVMACLIVLIELGIFQAVYIISSNNYILATVISFAVGVILNWIFGRKFIFNKSHLSEFREFIMVLIASLVGVGLQLGVVALVVQALFLYPLVGKGCSILVSFFWNYWFRAAFVYKHSEDS